MSDKFYDELSFMITNKIKNKNKNRNAPCLSGFLYSNVLHSELPSSAEDVSVLLDVSEMKTKQTYINP